jgi:sugar/nucleoside kinase (ribokinase family)
MAELIAFGELLIDFSPAGNGKMGNPAFEMNPGGAPLNCAAALCRLGGSAAYIGKVGRDLFGDFILREMEKAKMDTRSVVRTENAHTTLAFVNIDAGGEREFSFLRRHGADVLIEKDEVDLSVMKDARMLQYGSLSFTGQPARDTSVYIIEAAKERGLKICYDPNYRPMLWESEAAAAEQMRRALSFADIVKMSENEMALLLGVSNDAFSKGAQRLFEAGVEVALITAGREGAYFATREEEGFVPGFSVRAVDTTGCGDAFTGAFQYMTLSRPESSMREKVRFANAVGALCATKMGGMPAMPSLDETNAFLASAKTD